MIKKIISGGQTGADQAALDAAIKLNLPHGGWIPHGRLTEDGPLPNKYQLLEMPTEDYPARTEKNVLEADGTLILSHGKVTGGSKLTQKLTKEHNKPCLHVDLTDQPVFYVASDVYKWVLENEIQVINVAGSRASKDPEIYEDTYNVIRGILMLSIVKADPGDMPADYRIDEYMDSLPAPKTIDEAVTRLMMELSAEDIAQIA